jgi:hypothetical protein
MSSSTERGKFRLVPGTATIANPGLPLAERPATPRAFGWAESPQQATPGYKVTVTSLEQVEVDPASQTHTAPSAGGRRRLA